MSAHTPETALTPLLDKSGKDKNKPIRRDSSSAFFGVGPSSSSPLSGSKSGPPALISHIPKKKDAKQESKDDSVLTLKCAELNAESKEFKTGIDAMVAILSRGKGVPRSEDQSKYEDLSRQLGDMLDPKSQDQAFERKDDKSIRRSSLQQEIQQLDDSDDFDNIPAAPHSTPRTVYS